MNVKVLKETKELWVSVQQQMLKRLQRPLKEQNLLKSAQRTDY